MKNFNKNVIINEIFVKKGASSKKECPKLMYIYFFFNINISAQTHMPI